MDDIIRDFISETFENLQELEQVVLTLESEPENMELIRNAFRILHTIKGTCGFLGFYRMQTVAHRAENVLSKMRDGELRVSSLITSSLLVALDTIRQIADGIESKGAEPNGNDHDLLHALDQCLTSQIVSSPINEEGKLSEESEEANTPAHDPEPEPALKPHQILPTLPEEKTAPDIKTNSLSKEEDRSTAHTNQSIRINLEIVDNLMALVGELVLTRNQLFQQKEEMEIPSTQNNVLTRLSHLTTELQQNIMKTRMQPIETAWTKLPRLVRDIARELGKKINVKQIGSDTELDRQVIELIKDPLLHMVRNSADHGIEMPNVRRTCGKNETGTITLKSYHHGGHIVIEITDDGKGIDPEIIRRKAIEKDVISVSEAERMSSEQILQVIFKPGFSTAEQVSNVSGRGVGMDVVRSNIEKLGGTIEMQSIKGEGSSFIMKIPLTLSIISVLLVSVSGQHFAIPQLAITEILSFKKKSSQPIEAIQDKPLLRWRNQLLPLIYLDEILAIHDDVEKSAHNIIVTQIGHQHFGFIVDSIHDSQEIVVKPLSRKLKKISTFSGSTILGNGEVVLILDPNNFDLQLDPTNASPFESKESPNAEKVRESTIILIFKSDQKTKAVPLALVSRIDEIQAKDIQNIYGQHIFRHRDQLIPLMDFTNTDVDPETFLPILIFTDRGYKLALKIDEIMTIVEDSTEIQLESSNSETLGTAIIANTPTIIIDCQAYFKKAYPHWHERLGHSLSPRVVKRLLLVDDSTFFHNLISPLLRVSGYVVKTASSAEQGLQMCKEAKHPFDIIISDIEMPDKNGYDFLAEIKANEELSHIPVIALSANDTEEEILKSKKAGFNDFVRKTDQQTLIRVLHQLCTMETRA
mgnify:CR=1 FL=1